MYMEPGFRCNATRFPDEDRESSHVKDWNSGDRIVYGAVVGQIKHPETGPSDRDGSGTSASRRTPNAERDPIIPNNLPQESIAFRDRLGHRFRCADLLVEALTHSSLTSSTRPDNQRLEFLGDRVLGLIIAEELMAIDPEANEGELALRFNSLVRKETCADVARQLELGTALRLGRAEMLSGGRRKDALLADAMEAVIAAVFLDAGFSKARTVVLSAWGERVTRARQDAKDPKTALQELAQSQGYPPPEYTLVSRDGPDHAPVFTIQVRMESGETAISSAGSKKVAEQVAARALLQRTAPQPSVQP